MLFKYLGNKGNMTAFGYDFSDGATPDVTEDHIIRKFNSNSHFEAVTPIETAEPVAEVNIEVSSVESTVKPKGKPGRKKR